MKIGIITMHKVINFGSVLQAYALQKHSSSIGYDTELINYDYHPPLQKLSIYSKLIRLIMKLLFGFLLQRKLKRFNEFSGKNLKIGKVLYTQENIADAPPNYDTYISGSDQVWNPSFIKNDTSFLLSFVPESKSRISYASSFAINDIPEQYRRVYAKELSKFKAISVREQTGVEIISSLINKKAELVCDPALLLDRKDWDELANQSMLHMEEPYILVYVLTYMYNPYPEIDRIISNVQKELGNMKLVILEGSKKDYFKSNSKVVKDAGPMEFIYLFKHASFVITTSFHGTAFSIIYGKPFYAVIKDGSSNDDRIPSILKKLGCEKSLINYTGLNITNKENLFKLKCDTKKLYNFRESSRQFLKDSLLNIGK